MVFNQYLNMIKCRSHFRLGLTQRFLVDQLDFPKYLSSEFSELKTHRKGNKTNQLKDEPNDLLSKPTEYQFDKSKRRLTHVNDVTSEDKFLHERKYEKYRNYDQNLNPKSQNKKENNPNGKSFERSMPLFETPNFKYANSKTKLFGSRNEEFEMPCKKPETLQLINEQEVVSESIANIDNTDVPKVYKFMSSKLSKLEMQKFKNASYESFVPNNMVNSTDGKETISSSANNGNEGDSRKVDRVQMEEQFYSTYKIIEKDEEIISDTPSRGLPESKQTDRNYPIGNSTQDERFRNSTSKHNAQPSVLGNNLTAEIEVPVNNPVLGSVESANYCAAEIEQPATYCSKEIEESQTEIEESQNNSAADIGDVSFKPLEQCKSELFLPNEGKVSTALATASTLDQHDNGNDLHISKNHSILETEEDYILDVCTKRSKKQKNKLNIEIQGEILYGYFPVLISLQKSRRLFHTIYLKEVVKDTKRQVEIEKLAAERGIEIKLVNVPTLDAICERPVHQGVCADVSLLENLHHSDELTRTETVTGTSPPPVWLVMDSIHDPMNFGAILRSAYFFGVHRIFQGERNSCKLSPVVSKASAGIMELVDIFTLKDIQNFLKGCKDNGWLIVGTGGIYSPGPTVHLQEFQLERPTVLIVGNEARGMKQSTNHLCDFFLTIRPAQALHPSVDSLNVGVATGVILSHLLPRHPT